MTGFATLVYLNQTPFQPRERDYAYLSASCLCDLIGLGLMRLIGRTKHEWKDLGVIVECTPEDHVLHTVENFGGGDYYLSQYCSGIRLHHLP